MSGRRAPLRRMVTIARRRAGGRLGELLESDPGSALAQAEDTAPRGVPNRASSGSPPKPAAGWVWPDAEDAELAGIQAALRVPGTQRGRGRRTGRPRGGIPHPRQALPRDISGRPAGADHGGGGGHPRVAYRTGRGAVTTVLGRAPHFLRAIMLHAKYLVLQARLKEAIRVVEEVVCRKPNNKTALEYLAELHAEANDHEQAVEVYGRCSHWTRPNSPCGSSRPSSCACSPQGRKHRRVPPRTRARSQQRGGVVGPGELLPCRDHRRRCRGDGAGPGRAQEQRRGGRTAAYRVGIFAERRGDAPRQFEHIASGQAASSNRAPL